MVNTNSFDTFYKNLPSVRAKSVDVFNNVCSFSFKIVCFNRNMADLIVCSHIFFLHILLMRDVTMKSGGGGAPVAVAEAVRR
jgi:hypothetical protein